MEMMNLKMFFSCCFALVCLTVFPQDKIPNTFRYPLDGNVRFSGNYGELRPNHFHAGIDFSTDPVKNLPIYSIEEGYVSRIKIGSHGYGKVLYVTHPGGYVSVYGHQHHFAKKIADFAYTEQKKQEAFEIEVFPKAGELPVKKGEVIGYTGNTGNTTGPHLHFEIRDEKTEVPLNPQLFLEHEDNFKPVCTRAAVYSIHACGKPELVSSFETAKYTKNNETAIPGVIILPQHAGLAFSCFDKESSSGGKNQVYGITIKVDGEPIYTHKMNGISFDFARYVNWFQDVTPSVKNEKLQKCFRTGNNDLPVYNSLKNDGAIYDASGKFSQGKHQAQVEFFDVKGNKSTLNFTFMLSDKPALPEKKYDVECLKENKFNFEGIEIVFPEKSFFYDLNKDIGIHKKNPAGYYSGIYKVFSDDILLLKGYEASVKVNRVVPADKQDKLCLLVYNDAMGSRNYCGGNFSEWKVSGTVKYCGLLVIGIDTVPPLVTGGIKGAKNIGVKRLNFKVSDNLSGIGKFRLEINGQWVLAEYEHKTNSIFYELSNLDPKGKLNIVLKVWDKRSNLTTVAQSFTR